MMHEGKVASAVPPQGVSCHYRLTLFLNCVRVGPRSRHSPGQRAAAPGVPDTTSLKFTLLILAIIPLLHNIFPGARSSCRRPFIALSPGMVNGGIISHHEFKARPPLPCCCATRGESRRGSSVSGGRVGHQPPSGVRTIVPEATPDMQRKINETKRVFGQMHLQGNERRERENSLKETEAAGGPGQGGDVKSRNETIVTKKGGEDEGDGTRTKVDQGRQRPKTMQHRGFI